MGGDKMGFRITGIDTPLGGISWEYTEAERNSVQEIFFFLESKRLLVNPIEMEVKSWCEQSALEIKNEIVSVLMKNNFSNDTKNSLRTMITACNDFLDNLCEVEQTGIIYKNHNGDWENSTFSSSMKKFRKVFRDNINTLSTRYDLIFSKKIPE